MHADLVQKRLDYLTKGAVAAGSTSDATWAAPLTAARQLVDPILSLIQQQSLLGRIPGLRSAPFNCDVPAQTGAGGFAWVGEGIPKPITKFPFATLKLWIGKVSGIVVLTTETVRAPNSAATIRDALVVGVVDFQDRQLLDPAITEIANVRPASITNGVTPTTATGNLQTDVGALLAAFYTNRPGAARPVLVMSPATAGRLAGTGNHPDLRVDGGVAFGVPVVTSTGADLRVVALDAAAVVFADGGIEFDVTEQAMLDMSDSPAPPTAATILVSTWQANLAAFRVERTLWWKAAANAVQYLVTS